MPILDLLLSGQQHARHVKIWRKLNKDKVSNFYIQKNNWEKLLIYMACKFCILHFTVSCWSLNNNAWRITIFSEFQTSKNCNETVFLPPYSEMKNLWYFLLHVLLYFFQETVAASETLAKLLDSLRVSRPQQDSK